MKFSVCICEPGEIGYPDEARSAKILMIKEDGEHGYLVTIEISLYSYKKSAWHISPKDKKLTRSFRVISHKFCDFISDETGTLK